MKDEDSKKTLALIVPCYNEEAVLSETAKQLRTILTTMQENGEISSKSRIVFIDDGCSDKTWEIISLLSNNDKSFIGIKLSKNCGHQNALLAGLTLAEKISDISISIDADLQQDINAIPRFIEKHKEGYDVVLGIRKKRTSDSMFKKTTGYLFYKLMVFMGINITPNHTDYRLLSKKALTALFQYQESNLFLRGLIPDIGFKTTTLYYEQYERAAGKSKYHFRNMLAFALDGITSFSIYPIRLIFFLGLLVSFMSVIAITSIIIAYFLNKTVQGWSSILVSVWFLGGIQLISVGIIGEYVGRAYKETKKRPKFIIEHAIGL